MNPSVDPEKASRVLDLLETATRRGDLAKDEAASILSTWLADQKRPASPETPTTAADLHRVQSWTAVAAAGAVAFDSSSVRSVDPSMPPPLPPRPLSIEVQQQQQRQIYEQQQQQQQRKRQQKWRYRWLRRLAACVIADDVTASGSQPATRPSSPLPPLPTTPLPPLPTARSDEHEYALYGACSAAADSPSAGSLMECSTAYEYNAEEYACIDGCPADCESPQDQEEATTFTGLPPASNNTVDSGLGTC